jgi:hypothetical protein
VAETIRTDDIGIAGRFTRLELLETVNRIRRGSAIVEVAPRD